MNKTGRTKFLKSLLLMALAIVMCLSAMTTGFAANGTADAADEDHPAEAVITKLFKVPEGTTIPASATFTFDFAKKSYNGDSTTAGQAVMPTPSSAITVAPTGGTTATVSGITTVTKDTGDIGAKFAFTQAGVYIYTVTEATGVGYTPGSGEHFTNSQAQYEVTFWVKNHTTSGVYIEAIGVSREKEDDGTPTSGKLDIVTTPGAFAFTNLYYMDTGVTDPTGAVALGVSKKVDTSGTYVGDVNKYFAFEVVATRPSTLPATDYVTYTANIRNATSKAVVTIVASHAVSGGAVAGNTITYTPSATLMVSLKHDEELVFTQMPVGATYTATEKGAAGYTASVDIVVNGATAITKNGSLGTDLDTDAAGPAKRIIGQNANSAAFLNQGIDAPITGINMNNMPFYAILLLVAGAFVAFIVVKSRRREVRDN